MLRSATLIHPGTPLYFIVFTEFGLNKDRIPFISLSAGQNIIQCRNAGVIFSFGLQKEPVYVNSCSF